MNTFLNSPPRCAYTSIVPDNRNSNTPNIQPLPYQEESASRISSHWKQDKKRVLAQGATGSGKPIILAALIRKKVQYGHQILKIPELGYSELLFVALQLELKGGVA